MSWSERSPGLYERPLGAVERLMIPAVDTPHAIAREPVRIHAFADLTVRHPIQALVVALRQAWTAMRLLHSPDIATTFGDGCKRYQAASDEELDAWQHKTFRVAPMGTAVEEVVREMQQRLEPLPVLYLVPREIEAGLLRCSLVLFISHWRTEATGAFKVIDQLVDYAADLLVGNRTQAALSAHSPGSETRLLTPTLEDITMPGQPSSAASVARIQAAFAAFSSHHPVLDFAIKGNRDAAPSHMAQNQRIYTPASTRQLVAACKKQGISVTAAIHAAYLDAVWQQADGDRKTRPYASIMPTQVRTRLSATSPYRAQGCWNAAQMLLLSTPAHQEYLSRARSLHAQYGLATDETWLHEDMRALSEETLAYLTRTPIQTDALPFITSMGLLDGNVIVPSHGPLEIEQVSVWADSLGLGIVFGLWTFRGKLNLQISWNVAYHTDAQVQQTMDLIDSVFAAQLGVEMDMEQVRRLNF